MGFTSVESGNDGARELCGPRSRHRYVSNAGIILETRGQFRKCGKGVTDVNDLLPHGCTVLSKEECEQVRVADRRCPTHERKHERICRASGMTKLERIERPKRSINREVLVLKLKVEFARGQGQTREGMRACRVQLQGPKSAVREQKSSQKSKIGVPCVVKGNKQKCLKNRRKSAYRLNKRNKRSPKVECFSNLRVFPKTS